MRVYVRKIIFTLVCLLCGVMTAFSADSAAPSKDDMVKRELDFATRLVQKFPINVSFDLAEELCANALKGNPTDAVKFLVDLTRAQIKRSKINIPDPSLTYDKRSALFDGAIQELEKCIKTYQGKNYTELADAQFGVGDLWMKKGEFLTREMAKEERPDKVEAIQNEAKEAFKKATEYFSALIIEYRKERDAVAAKLQEEPPEPEKIKIQAELDELDGKLGIAEYYRPQTIFSHGLLYPTGNENRVKLLKEAALVFEEFMLVYGQTTWGYQAANEKGLCYLELEDYDSALMSFNTTSEFLPAFLKEANAPIGEAERDVIEKGFALKARAYRRMGDYKKAIEGVEKLLKTFPDALTRKDEFAQQAMLEKASALFRLRDISGSFKIIDEIIATKGPMSKEANSRRQKLIKYLGPDRLPPDAFFDNIQFLYDSGESEELLRQAKQFLTALANYPDDVKQKYIPNVLWILGNYYQTRRPPRLYEALVVFEYIFKNYKNATIMSKSSSQQGERIAPKAANNATACYYRLADETKDEAYRTRAKEIVKSMADAGDLPPEKAADLFYMEGRYLEAAGAYKKIRQSSDQYVKSLARLGPCYYSHAKKVLTPEYEKEQNEGKKEKLKEEIIKHLKLSEESDKAFLDFIGKNAESKEYPEAERKKMKNTYKPSCLIQLARVYRHEFIKQYADVLSILGDFDKDYGGNTSLTDMVVEALQYKIEALINSNELAKADSYLEMALQLVRKYKLMMPMGSILSVADEYEKVANKFIPPELGLEERAKKIEDLKQKKPADYEKFVKAMEKNVDQYYRWLDNNPPATTKPEYALAVADKLFRAAEDLFNNEYYKKAASIYEKLLEKFYGGEVPKDEAPWKTRWKNARCYVKLTDWPKAIPLLELVERETKNDPKILGGIMKDLAMAYEEAGGKENLNKALTKWAELVRGLKEQTEPWWEARYHILLVYMKMGADGGYQEADKMIKNIEFATEEKYDDNQFGYKDKFLKVKSELAKILPGK
ncbi:MAG: hypothetical protein HY811_00360 [Planctomycetes bacterium]|nr:hypothetical protein [Planctomycetota bacterium]